MADSKISDLTDITTGIDAADYFPVDDVSAGATKKVTRDHLLPVAAAAPIFTPVGAPASTATGATNTYYALAFNVPYPTTITGIEVKNGATVNGSMRPYLCNFLGNLVSGSTASVSQSGTNARQRIPFDAGAYSAAASIFYAVMWYTSATATAFMAPCLGNVGATGTTATPNTISVTAADLSATSVALIRPY